MKTLSLIHLGIGNVGREIIKQIANQHKHIEKELGVSLTYYATFSSKNSKEEIDKAIASVALPFVLIDTTASDETIPYIHRALKRGGFVVLANKKPLSGSQEDFNRLQTIGAKRLFYECVVGAGLPVIRPLQDFLLTGDGIIEIQGCFSGTLGFLFSQLDNGKSFSEAVIAAKEKGFTEPDPRDDLSGKDVARKALILSRVIGKKLELRDIRLESLYPEDMQSLSIEDFLKNVRRLDASYKKRVEKAKKENKVLRFVARVTMHECTVGLQEVDATSDIGNLKGPDNILVFNTKRYAQNPLVIKGPGAGIEVTAAGVFADVLSIAKIIGGTNQ